jgi:MYXO-CTERM domain-containing protein
MSPEQRGPDERPINSPDPTPEEIRREIDATREVLGDTVEALAEKTDVKAKANAKVEELRQDPKPLAIAAAVLVLLLLLRRRRRR